MKDNLDIEKLFKDKFESFEPAVNASVWEGVAAKVASGTTSAAAGTGTTLWLKSIIIGAVATVVGVGAWTYFADNDNNEVNSKAKEVVAIAENEMIIENKADEITLENEIEQISVENQVTLTEKEGVVLKTNLESEKVNHNNVENNNPIISMDKQNNNPVTRSNNQAAGDVITGKSQEINNNTPGVNHPSQPTTNSNAVNSSNGVDKVISENQPNNTENANLLQTTVDEQGKVDDVPVIEEKVAVEDQSYIKNIPNIFTPNNDNINDLFYIEELSNLREFYIVIYTKSNMKVYESTNPDFKWDGYDMSGRKVKNDVYYYLIKAVGNDEETYSIPGQITVL